MASRSSHDQPTVAVHVPFETWLGNPTKGSMTWVIAGRSYSGKSTLVKNLLGLADSPVSSTSSDAKSIEVYHHSAGNPGVELTIVEVPGLDSGSQDEEFSVVSDELQNVIKPEGEADVLLYCISIAPNARVPADIESKIITLLTTVLKPQIWKRVVLVFTSADYVKDRHTRNPVKNRTLDDVMKEYAQKFEELLKAANVESFTVLPVYDVQDSNRVRPAQEIPALPVGETLSARLLQNMRWEEHLYSEMLTKCTLRAVPMLVNIGKNRLSKGNAAKGVLIRASFFGLNAAVFAYMIATRCCETTSLAGVLLGAIIGGIVAYFARRFRPAASTWASSARSIAQVRFQQDQVAMKLI